MLLRGAFSLFLSLSPRQRKEEFIEQRTMYDIPVATTYVSLGSNIDAEYNLRKATELLRTAFPDIRFSSVYRTAARDREDQPDFLNAAARFETDLKPAEILGKLQSIEQALGKKLPFRFGPRTIDLDLLLSGGLISDDPSLTLPHSRMHERRFVLEPLCALINPESCHPLLKQTWQSLLEKTMNQHCERVNVSL